MANTSVGLVGTEPGGLLRPIRNRRLEEYPQTGARLAYLGLTVLVTIALYYMAYCGGSVSTLILADLHMSFLFFIVVTAIGNVVGAGGAYFAGLTDRVGRCNMIIGGLLVVSLLTTFALPNVHNRYAFSVLALILGNIEGIVLVATPALVRDFSPQLGRARAMGFWTLGPVIGSLIVSVVGVWTIHGTPPPRFWGHEYVIAGIAGLAVTVLAFLYLRELAPELRNQIMVSADDRTLLEARAKGIDIEASLRHPFRQMLRPDLLISGFAMSVLLLAYYTSIALGVIIFETVYGFNLHEANGLGNWTWGINALTVVSVGILSDRLRVRKPFMVAGAMITALGIALYLERFGHPTSYLHVALLISLISFGLGIAYTPWMASYTETVEAHNPALTATGLAVWGLTLRVVVFVALLIIPAIINTVNPLVAFAVGTNGYTAEVTFAGTHQALIAQVLSPQNALELTALDTLTRTDPADMAAIAANTSSLDTLKKFPAEVDAIKANPTLFTKLAADPLNPSLQAQAVAALGGGQIGAQRLTIVATMVPALNFAKSHPQVIAFVQSHLAVLNWAAQHASLLAQVKANAGQLAGLSKIPASVEAYATAHGASALKAEKDAPGQYRTWYWICFAGAVIFLFGVPLLKGRWSPRRARQDAEEHEAFLQAEMAKLAATDA